MSYFILTFYDTKYIIENINFVLLYIKKNNIYNDMKRINTL